VWNIDELEFRDVEARSLRGSDDLFLRPNENWNDQTGFGRLDRAPQRNLVTRVRNGGLKRLVLLSDCNEPFVFLVPM
jgi:hypothetical protein